MGVTCTTVTPLAAGRVIELTVNFIPQFLGTNSLTASVSQSRPEADLSDNTAVVPFNTVEQADLAAFLTLRGSSPARITRGSVEVYQAKVRNNGFSASADVHTVFTVPSNGVLELVEGGAGNTTCGPLDEALRTVTCTTFPGYRMPASTEVLTLASFTVLFPSDLNVTGGGNGGREGQVIVLLGDVVGGCADGESVGGAAVSFQLWSSSLSWAPLAFSSGRSPPPTLKSKPPRP